MTSAQPPQNILSSFSRTPEKKVYTVTCHVYMAVSLPSELFTKHHILVEIQRLTIIFNGVALELN